jgi:hypothetical protein
VKISRHIALFTPITLALTAGLLITATAVAAAATDSRWTPTGAQQQGSADRPVWSMAVSPLHPAVLLQATQGRGVLRSTDSGATWSSAITGVDAAWVVGFDPRQPGTAYAGTQTAGVYKSVDEGKTWTARSEGLPTDVRSIAMAGGLLIAGTSRGVFYSNDAAVSWHTLGLESQSIAAVALLPKAGGITLFAGADNGTVGAGFLMKTEGLNGSWAVVKGNFPGDAVVASVAVAPSPSGGAEPPVLAGTSQGLFRSDDRGTSWNPVNGLPSTDFNVALFNPANADQIYVASDGDQGNGGVFRSLDRGASWSTFGAGLPVRPRITALALQPLNPAQLLAAAWNPTDNSAGAYQIVDTAATVAGVTSSAAPSATAIATPAPRASAPVPVPVRPGGGLAQLAPFGVVLAAVLAIGAIVLVRRWRLGREDRRTYGT